MEGHERQSRVRCNIERTASNKVVRGLTYEHVAGETVTHEEAEADVNEAVRLFIHLEAELAHLGVG